MKPLYLRPRDNWEIEITVSTREGSRPVHMADSEADRLLNEPDYQKLQAELQEKYWFLFRDKVNKILD